ncbi:MAG TPA: zinc-binding dehydrogenase, partial [Pyrinomonadaceae bacterium]|nr:zinc-binding dehydrogenase [Pyrinomonadaceae bacterium]
HAEYLCLPEENLFLVPENISDVEAVFIEPFAAALGIFDSYRFEPGLRLAVIGDGRLGLLCAFASRARGFCPVLIGHNKDKMQIAKNRGIETLLENEASVLYASCDVVIEASGSVSGFNLAAEISRPRGTIILKSTLSGQIQWPATKVVVNELRVLGSRCGRFAPAIDLLTNINLNLQELVTDVIPLSRGIEAFKIAENKNSLKVILDTTS